MEFLIGAAISLFAGFVISGINESSNSKQAKREKERAEEQLAAQKKKNLTY